MPQTAHTVSSADLLVHGTYALRRALGRFTRPGPDELPRQAMRSTRLVAEQLAGRTPVPVQVGGRAQPDNLAAANRR